ncbi:MAG: hypothetical protein ACTSSE_15550 [Candidatus Thorarchaeota archaeon]
MRIKAVLRDTDILQLEAGSKERILAGAKKNMDRAINWPSLLKVMGLSFKDRLTMLEILADTKIHVWLITDADQHIIFLSHGKGTPIEAGYQWQ